MSIPEVNGRAKIPFGINESWALHWIFTTFSEKQKASTRQLKHSACESHMQTVISQRNTTIMSNCDVYML